jgi:hypothetical protein
MYSYTVQYIRPSIYDLFIFYSYINSIFLQLCRIFALYFFVKYDMDEENLNSYAKVLKLSVHMKF